MWVLIGFTSASDGESRPGYSGASVDSGGPGNGLNDLFTQSNTLTNYVTRIHCEKYEL